MYDYKNRIFSSVRVKIMKVHVNHSVEFGRFFFLVYAIMCV